MISKKTTTAFAAFLIAGFAAAATAQAAPSSNPSGADSVSLKVSLAGVNLSSKEGAKIALARIHEAARGICGDQPDPRLLNEANQYRACMKQTVDSAVASLDAPIVTAMNNGSGDGAVVVASGDR